MEENYILDLSIEDVHLLYDCVVRRIETWEGHPSRHPSEQEHLYYLKDWLYRLILEYKFNNM
jgi:hypothetical protein